MDTFRPGPTDSIVRFHLTNFLLENLAHEGHVDWLQAFKAHKRVAQMLGLVARELPWLAARTDPQGQQMATTRC